MTVSSKLHHSVLSHNSLWFIIGELGCPVKTNLFSHRLWHWVAPYLHGKTSCVVPQPMTSGPPLCQVLLVLYVATGNSMGAWVCTWNLTDRPPFTCIHDCKVLVSGVFQLDRVIDKGKIVHARFGYTWSTASTSQVRRYYILSLQLFKVPPLLAGYGFCLSSRLLCSAHPNKSVSLLWMRNVPIGMVSLVVLFWKLNSGSGSVEQLNQIL